MTDAEDIAEDIRVVRAKNEAAALANEIAGHLVPLLMKLRDEGRFDEERDSVTFIVTKRADMPEVINALHAIPFGAVRTEDMLNGMEAVKKWNALMGGDKQ